MKHFKKVISVFFVLVSAFVLFSGCTYKKYDLVGIVKEGDNAITPISSLDDETKNYLATNYGGKATIDLNQNNTFTLEYSLVEGGLTVSYKQTGTFELKEKENIIIFNTPRADGSDRKSTQQYLNGAIIYFDGVFFLAFK